VRTCYEVNGLCREKPHIVNQVILGFLTGEHPPTMSGHQG
jgi:hypothetical protein